MQAAPLFEPECLEVDRLALDAGFNPRGQSILDRVVSVRTRRIQRGQGVSAGSSEYEYRVAEYEYEYEYERKRC